MKNIHLFGGLLVVLFLSFSACTKYDPIYGVADTKNTQQLQLKKDFVYIHDYDIYMFNEILAEQKRLTNSPSVPKTHVAFSPNHDKIAYLNASGTPVIIDTSGVHIETLNSYTNVKDLKWHRNNGAPTLYMLVNDEIKFHGPSLSIPSQPFSHVFPPDASFMKIDAVEIDNDLNIAFSYRYQQPYSPTSPWRKFYHGVGMKFSTSSISRDTTMYDGYYTTASSYAAQIYPYFHSVSITTNQTIIVGQTSNTNENDYAEYSLYEYDYNADNLNIFTGSLSYMNLYEKNNKGYAGSNPYQIRKYLNVLPLGVPQPVGLANTFTYNLDNQNDIPPTYFDWQP